MLVWLSKHIIKRIDTLVTDLNCHWLGVLGRTLPELAACTTQCVVVAELCDVIVSAKGEICFLRKSICCQESTAYAMSDTALKTRYTACSIDTYLLGSPAGATMPVGALSYCTQRVEQARIRKSGIAWETRVSIMSTTWSCVKSTGGSAGRG